MNTQRLIQSAFLTGVTVLICHWGTPAQANTQRGSSGISSGSEVVGGFQPSSSFLPSPIGSGTTIGQSMGSQIAASTTQAAIVALNEGKPFPFTLNGGIATVAFVTTTSSDGIETTVMKLNLPSSGGGNVSKEFAVGDRSAASRIGGVIAGVLTGLEGSKNSVAMWDRAIALASQTSSVEVSNSTQANSQTAGTLASQLTGLLTAIDRLQLGQEQNLDEVASAIALFNNLVQTSSPEMLVVLAQQPEFVAIRSQLVTLRSQFKK